MSDQVMSDQVMDVAGPMVNYMAAMNQWREACHSWAENETSRLWEPWTVWEVRYVPWPLNQVESLPEEWMQTIYTLDAPEDFIKPGAQFFAVDRVTSWNGEVTDGFVFTSFLDARPVYCKEPVTTRPMAYHRHYSAAGFVVNVPAWVLEKPAPAPVEPVRPEGYDGRKSVI